MRLMRLQCQAWTTRPSGTTWHIGLSQPPPVPNSIRTLSHCAAKPLPAVSQHSTAVPHQFRAWRTNRETFMEDSGSGPILLTSRLALLAFALLTGCSGGGASAPKAAIFTSTLLTNRGHARRERGLSVGRLRSVCEREPTCPAPMGGGPLFLLRPPAPFFTIFLICSEREIAA